MERLLAEIGGDPHSAGPLETVHFGGGTPSELTAPELRSVLEALHERFGLAPGAEVTVEANPEGLDAATLDALLDAGVTRLSLGVQSFDDEALRTLGRRHSAEQAREAVRFAARAGFRSFGLDLIHGVPGLDRDRSLRSIELALELGAPHVSHYGLTYHEQTSLGRKREDGRIRPMDEDLEADIFEGAVALLTGAGLEHYEISNFGREGHRSRHNLACWLGEEYLAFGPSGVGFVSGRRWRNPASLNAWLAGAPPEVELIDARTGAVESVIAGLRLVREGLDRQSFRARHGQDVAEVFSSAVTRGQELGVLDLDETRLRLANLRAVLLYDSVISLFVEDHRSEHGERLRKASDPQRSEERERTPNGSRGS